MGELIISFGSELLETMGDDQKWIDDGWRKNGAHLREWVDKTNKFIKHAFSLSNIGITRYHAASVEMVYPMTRKRFQYTFVCLVICQAMRCGCTMVRKCLKMSR
jgi:hypothetical protein